MTAIKPGGTVDYVLPIGDRRVRGVVTAVTADGLVTAEFPQPGLPPMTVTGRAEDFIHVTTTLGEATQ